VTMVSVCFGVGRVGIVAPTNRRGAGSNPGPYSHSGTDRHRMQPGSRAKWANRPRCHAPVRGGADLPDAAGPRQRGKAAGDRIAVNDILTGGQHRTPHRPPPSRLRTPRGPRIDFTLSIVQRHRHASPRSRVSGTSHGRFAHPHD
jgi:hypothetical protein